MSKPISSQSQNNQENLQSWFIAAKAGDYSDLLRYQQYARRFDENSMSALMITCSYITPAHLTCTKFLLQFERGLQNQFGATALHVAAASGNLPAIQLLIQFEKNLKLSDTWLNCPQGACACQIAGFHGYTDCFNFLVPHEPSSQITADFLQTRQLIKQDSLQRTPLMYACFMNLPIVNYSQFDSCQDVTGLTALMHLIIKNKFDQIKTLLKSHQKELKVQSKRSFEDLGKGFTALILACYLNRYQIAELLLPERNLQTDKGQLAVDFCKNAKCRELKFKLKEELQVKRKNVDVLFQDEIGDLDSEFDLEVEDVLEEKEDTTGSDMLRDIAKILKITNTLMIPQEIKIRKQNVMKKTKIIKPIAEQLQILKKEHDSVNLNLSLKNMDVKELQDQNNEMTEFLKQNIGEFKVNMEVQITRIDKQIETEAKETGENNMMCPETNEIETQAVNDEGAGDHYFNVVTEAAQMVQSRYQVLQNLKSYIEEEKTDFVKQINSIHDQFCVCQENADMEVIQSVMESSSTNPFQKKTTHKKIMLGFDEYQEMMSVNYQIQQEIQAILERNAEMKQILEK
ncbi:Ankyrin_repeat-containing protein [Hexamita inflata]|uniref:Ankyrin repeat-containing protein n=1 Tax=Hexamita inflata TaxID=28002 RepID=A0AA86RP83_9EUKA|nr:Ankyrin repeat-containing protein [Hexamita inflata]